MSLRPLAPLSALYRRRGRAAFSPTSIPGLQVWLAADVLALADGDPVATWPDASGNGYDFSQSIAARRPVYRSNVLNGRPVVRFAGVDDQVHRIGLDLGSASDFTFIFVIKPSDTTPVGLVDTGPGTAFVFRNYPGGAWEWHADNPTLAAALPSAAAAVLTLELTRTPSRAIAYYRNGAAAGSAVGSGTTGVNWHDPAIGAVNETAAGYVGDLAEALIYSVALANADRAAVEGYLGSKYAIS